METLTKQLESSALVFGVRFQNISVLHSRPLCGFVSAIVGYVGPVGAHSDGLNVIALMLLNAFWESA